MASIRFVPLALAAALAPIAGAAASGFPRAPSAQRATTTSVVIRWSQDDGSPGTLTVAPAGAPRGEAPTTVPVSAADGKEHEVTLSGLRPGTRYAFTVESGGAVARGGFTTLAAPGQPVSFLVYGDNRSWDADHASVVRAMAREGVDFLVNTGDIVPHGTSSDYDNFFRIEAPLLAENVLFPTLGNHELFWPGGIGQWKRSFATPSDGPGGGRYYAFDAGDSTFVVLDFNQPGAKQTAWLDETLAAARRRGAIHLFAFLHHGPYDSGDHGENRTAQRDWVPIFRRFGVDLIFSGHDHDYERGYVPATGLRYVVSGGGGAPIYDENTRRPYQQVFAATLHYVRVDVAGPTVTVTARRPDGTVIDHFSFSVKPPPVAANPEPVAAPPAPVATPPVAGVSGPAASAADLARGETRAPFGLAAAGLALVAAAALVALRRARRA